MKENDIFSFNANVKIELFNINGDIKDTRIIHNTVTTAGKYGVMDQILASPTLGVITHMELGTGTGGTTKLNSYISNSRTAFSSKTRNTNVVTIITSFGPGVGTASITEAGTFDTDTQDSGNMWMYASFTAINKGVNDTLQITWTLTAN